MLFTSISEGGVFWVVATPVENSCIYLVGNIDMGRGMFI